MKKVFLVSYIFLLSNYYARPQGCMAVRQVPGFGSDMLLENFQPTDKWLFNITNRYFEASTTFRGKEFITDTLVRNRIYTLNLSANRILNKGWSFALNVAISANSRKNSNDHGGPKTPKHITHSFGLGDIRFTVYKWLFNYAASGNIQAGLGFKLPTGDYKFHDYFIRNDSTKVLGPVDQAIQLGDGGTGITAELSAFYSLNRAISIFAHGYYLINPRDQNGVSNLKGRVATLTEIKSGSTVMSVSDQYSIRSGANFHYRKIVITAGLRYEGVPAEDLVGESNGFRRAGVVASVEPGVTYKMKKTLAHVYVTLPFKRKSIQSIPDKLATDFTGNYTITQAGFADYLVFVGVSFKL